MGMRYRGVTLATFVSVAIALVVPGFAAGQTPAAGARASEIPRTPEGHPDLAGAVWVTGPDSVLYTGDLETGVADEEARTIQGQELYPASSLVIHPPDGLIPYQPWAAAKRETIPHMRKGDLIGRKVAEREPASLRDIRPQTMCIPAAPRIVFDRDFRFIQTPGYVIMQWDWSHAYRVIPLDGRPRIHSNVKMAMGDARGRWEGDTLIVETTNMNDWDWLDAAGTFHSDAMTSVERFTVVDADTIGYEVTITDPNVFTRPWTAAFPIRARRDKDAVDWFGKLETACVEGERAVGNILGDLRKFPKPVPEHAAGPADAGEPTK